jgi:cytidylate kinase
MACNDKKKFATAEASSKASLRTKGAIDEFLNIKNENLFRKLNKEWSLDAKARFNIKGNLFSEENYKVVPNKEAFKQIDNSKGIFYQLEEGVLPQTASPQTLSLIKDFIKRIGVDTKSMQNIVVNGIKQDANGVALLMQKLIQVVDGKEAQALPEEAMHFAVAIIKQTNPKLYKKLMSEINNYQLKNEVFEAYGSDPAYQLDGKPDVIKLKEEAIAKVLVETIINNNENNPEKLELIAKSQSWWNDIIDYFKNLFTQSGFDKMSMDIISGKEIGTAEDIREGEDTFFLQKSKQEQIVNSLKEKSDKITLDTVKNEVGGEESKYFIDGKQIKNRVSNIIKTWYDILRSEKALNDSEFKKAVNTLKADKGTALHKDMEHAMSILTDENGKLRSQDELNEIIANDNHVSFGNPDNNDMYHLLRDNLRARMESFPKDTIFMSEVTIYDPKRDLAGTVDFLAITPAGKINILDWKFIGLDTAKFKDIPWYNVASWNRQMNQYKTIIKDNYGVENKDFEQTRMIPIKAVYSEGNAKTKALPNLLNVIIGDVNVKNIKEAYLIPVPAPGEKVIIENDVAASKKINLLLDKLNDVYAKLSDQKVLPSERLNKAEQLNALYSAIRQLQMKQDVGPLLYQAKVLNVQIQGIIETYNTKFKDAAKETLTPDEIKDFTEAMLVAEDALQHYTTLDLDLDFLFEGKTTDEEKNLKEELRETAYQSRKLKETLGDLFTEFTVNNIGGTEKGEKVVKDIFSKWLGSTSTIQIKSVQDLFKMANAAFGRAGMDTQSEVKRLTELKKSFQTWATAKGLTSKNMFSLIKKKGENQLIDQYQNEFYKTLTSKIEAKDFEWIKENVDVEAYKTYLEEKLKTEYKRIEDKPRVGSEEENYNAVTREQFEAKNLYDISTSKSVGWLLYNDIKNFPVETWETTEWKELHKPENKPALDFYNYIIERNNKYAEIGYIQDKKARTFLPWVRKGLSEKLIFGGKITLGEQFLKNISVDPEEVGYGSFDPLSGKVINKMPRYLVNEFDEEASEDLFKTMAMYNEFAIKFQYLSQIENQGRALLRLEQNKKAIATSQFGRTQKDEYGELVYTNDNNENTKLYEDMFKAIVYQQKYIQSEAFDQLLGKFGNFGTTINDKLGFKLLPENLDGRQISVNKAITQLNNTFQVTALGLNVLSSTSNYFGGTIQGLINAGKYFTKADYTSTEMWLLGNKMGGVDKQKILAALEYFVPFTENYNKQAATQLSLNKLDDQAIQDWLMVMMRKGDEAVQRLNFFSFLKNSIVIDGKVVNSREYLKSTDEYKEFYKGTEQERKDRADKFEKDIKTLNENQGVLALSTVENGELVIPGVDRKSDSVIELRRKVQSFTADALGSMTEENKRLMNLNIYGNSFMVFKNWIPRLIDVRVGNIKYNAASDAYEWGRTRMIARFVSDDFKGAIGNLKNSLMGNDKGMEYIRELYEKKRADYKADTNKELEMTEDEFIDLVRANIKNQLIDVLFYAGLWALFLGMKAMAPDDDEDPIVKNQWNFMLKATDKFKDEIGYFYNPGSLTSLVSKGAFPAMGLITNYEKALGGFLKETYALGTGDIEGAEKNQVIKYWMKTNPITNQAAGLLPMFYPSLAKDLGIRMQSQYGIR